MTRRLTPPSRGRITDASSMLLLAAAATLALALPTSHRHSHSQPRRSHCTSRDYTMSCVHATTTQPELAKRDTRATTPTAYGIDFGWTCPAHNPATFGASYLSYDPSKDWHPTCLASFRERVAVFEAGATEAQGSYHTGYNDARHASAELAVLGAPKGQPFDMAVDCDCAGPTLVSYFQGANAAEPGRINAYGGYAQIAYLHARHLVGNLNWQTYAWSGGLWLPASIAPLEQYLNGNTVDWDRAIAANYGQWPAASACWDVATCAPKPKPKPRPHCFGPHAQPHLEHCRKVRSQVAKWSRARASSQRALTATRHHETTLAHLDHLFASRVGLFDALIRKNLW